MNKVSKLATGLIVAILVLALAAPAALAGPGPGGEQPPNRGQERPSGPHQWGRGDDDVTPVNPPEGGQTAPEFGAETRTTLVVKVYGDLNANGVWDLEENGLEDVFVDLKTTAGYPVRFLKTGLNGQVVFLDLVAGDYVLDIRPQAGWSPALIPVEVLAGKTTTVEVGLKPVSTGG